MALFIPRRWSEWVTIRSAQIGPAIRVKVHRPRRGATGANVLLEIDAPRELRIDRGENDDRPPPAIAPPQAQ